MKRILMIVLACLILTMPVMGAEDYHDGDSEQVYVWVREGDATFCYINNGGWSEADMLTGWHTIDGETYYFYEMEMEDTRYGQMCTEELWYGDWTFFFDSEGHLTDWYQGPERE